MKKEKRQHISVSPLFFTKILHLLNYFYYSTIVIDLKLLKYQDKTFEYIPVIYFYFFSKLLSSKADYLFYFHLHNQLFDSHR